MKLLICSGVFGGFPELKRDADFMNADAILIAGNVTLDHSDVLKNIQQEIFYVTGKYENFSLERLKYGDRGKLFFIDSKPSVLWTENDEKFNVAGVSGTYSPIFYVKDTAPKKHMTKKDLFDIPEECEIVMLHNIPGQIAKSGSLDFHDDVFRFINEKKPKYIFIGGYDRFSTFQYYDTTVIFLTSLYKGYALIDTDNWSCYFQNKLS